MRLKSIFVSCLLLATSLVSTQKLPALDFGCMWDNLCNPCCDDGSSPYDEGKWSFSVDGGVTPTLFTRRGRDLIIDRTAGVFTVPFSRRTTKFDDVYNLPWTVGLELGYMFCCRWELFTDFDYTSAQGRHRTFTDVDGSLLSHRSHHYRTFDWYLGTRYYLPTLWCSFTPFVGGKMGLIHRNGSNADISRTLGPVLISSGSFTENRSLTTVSAGFQAGINWDISSCLAVTLKAEALFSGDLRRTFNDEFVPVVATSGPLVVLGQTGPVLHVPVTLGLRFSF